MVYYSNVELTLLVRIFWQKCQLQINQLSVVMRSIESVWLGGQQPKLSYIFYQTETKCVNSGEVNVRNCISYVAWRHHQQDSLSEFCSGIANLIESQSVIYWYFNSHLPIRINRYSWKYMSNDKCNTIAGKITILYNILNNYHQINFSSVDKQLLVLWVIRVSMGN